MQLNIYNALFSAAINDETAMTALLSKCSANMFSGAYLAMYEIFEHYDKSSLTIDSNLFLTECHNRHVPSEDVYAVINQPYSLDSIDSYIKNIGFEATRRQVLKFQSSINNCISVAKNQDDLLASLEQSLESNVYDHQLNSNDATVAVKDALPEYFAYLEQNANTPDGIIGLKTPLTELNTITKGLVPKDLIILAARPSMGKTAMLLSLLMDSIFSGDDGLIFSIEMPSEQVLNRLVCARAGINQDNLRTGRLTESEKIAFKNCVTDMQENVNLYINDKAGITTSEVRRIAMHRHKKSPNGLKFIGIDYLQLMSDADMDGESRTIRVGQITTALKGLAKELNIPIVLLSQLSRNLESRADKRPINSDLRESGSIEQDADLIMFIYRDEVYNEKTKEVGIAEVIIGKQRNGPLGTIKTQFQGQFTRFINNAK